MTINLVDGCCGAGLGADGYTWVGVRVRKGIDIMPQPNYPYPFLQANVMQWLEGPGFGSFDAGHFSFPCQFLTTAQHLRDAQGGASKWPDLLTPGLELLRDRWSHQAWIVENVDDRAGKGREIMAPRPGESLIVLCGSMFGLPIWRHRLFLTNFPTRVPPAVPGAGKYREQGCDHSLMPADPVSGRPRPWGIYRVAGDSIPDGGRTCRDAEHAREVMGVHRSLPWAEIKEGFPPAYTAYIGADLLTHLAMTRRAEVAA